MESTSAKDGIPLTITAADVIKEGWLYKESRFLKEWRKRWFVLTKGHLFSYKEMKIYSKPTEAIEMSKCRTVKSIEEEINRPHAFKLEALDRVFRLQAENYSEKEGWIGSLGKAMIKKSVLMDEMPDETTY